MFNTLNQKNVFGEDVYYFKFNIEKEVFAGRSFLDNFSHLTGIPAVQNFICLPPTRKLYILKHCLAYKKTSSK